MCKLAHGQSHYAFFNLSVKNLLLLRATLYCAIRQSNTTMGKLNLKNNNNRNSGSNNTKKRRRRRASNDMSSSSNDNSQKTILIAVILGLCLINILDVDISIGRHTNSSSGGGGRRSLLSSLYLSGPSTLLPWAQHHLVDVTDRPTETETALFWRKLLLFVCVFIIF